MDSSRNPTVSVIMAAHDAAGTIRASIDSILSQTCRDFELIVTDDGSADDTLAILESVDDPRLHILRHDGNRGVVAARNTCFAHARGRFVAMLDSDDLSAPTRLARQLAYLEANPGTVLLGTAAKVLDGGTLRGMRHPAVTTPGLIRWLLHLVNPLVCSSVMFRADPIRQQGEFMRASFTYAEDYEFYHRAAALGDIARLDSTLTIYRWHDGNMSKRHEQAMIANAVRVLEPAYTAMFGAGAHEAACLVVEHLSAGKPVTSVAVLRRLAEVFGTVNTSFRPAPGTDADTARALTSHSARIWQRMLHGANRAGLVGLASLVARSPAAMRPNLTQATRMAIDRAPLRDRTRDLLRWVSPAANRVLPKPGSLFSTAYEPAPLDPASPPTLFVVVDTEAEFDWHKPFARELTAVSAMDDIERGQEVFDRYGLRPIYVIDYPVASQPRGTHRLRAIMQRDGCAIGAHLHPWTTPPFEEEVSARNSYPGNLPAELEERKLATLMKAIVDALGVSPVFYKAGRYGFGPSTPAALIRHGIRVDFSVLPGADLRRNGGPDFRRLEPIPYRIAGTSILSVPMTRSYVGTAPSFRLVGEAAQGTAWNKILHINAILARTGLTETITLTPEGVTAAEQIRLLRAMIKRGTRQFVLHYHSPSLSPGHTPYARNGAEADVLLERLADICRFFFDQLGGLPGYPNDLLRMLDEPGSAVLHRPQQKARRSR